MIVHEMYRRNLTVAQCKAWSQNLGHEGAMTTLTSYEKILLEDQGKLVCTPVVTTDVGEFSELLALLKDREPK